MQVLCDPEGLYLKDLALIDCLTQFEGRAMQQGGMQLAQTSVSTGDFNQQGAGQGASAQGNGSGNGGGNGSRFGGGAQGQADSSTVAVSTPRVSTHDGAIDTFA